MGAGEGKIGRGGGRGPRLLSAAHNKMAISACQALNVLRESHHGTHGPQGVRGRHPLREAMAASWVTTTWTIPRDAQQVKCRSVTACAQSEVTYRA